jgi:sugar/nucleoside kinase (ribokinase family)
MLAFDVIDYSTTVNAQHLRLGNPIHHDGVYATVAALILDDDQRRTIVQTRDDDGRLRVHDLDWDVPVDVGTVTQYGIDRPGRVHVMPVHLKHGDLALRKARAYAAQRGGHVVVRQAIPDDMSLSGGAGVDDWQSLPAGA